jgi:hypothetical protein
LRFSNYFRISTTGYTKGVNIERHVELELMERSIAVLYENRTARSLSLK